ncbi:MAG: TonB family protein [Candidatus Tectomicrobia bacterium]|nr:TonB family protein [Candidatus Tectomicrobia bacterium]
MKQSGAEPRAEPSRELWAASLAVSVVLHTLLVLGVMGSSWLWGTSVFEPALSYTVSLVDAPLSLQKPSPPPAASPPPKTEAVVRQPSPKPNPAPEAAAVKKPPAPKPAPETKKTPTKPVQAAVPKPREKRSAAKPIKKRPKAAVKPQTSTSSEAQSALATLRQRQAEQEVKRHRAEAAAQQAAAERVAALRDQVAEENTVGTAAVRAAGLRQVRLAAYQERVRTQIIDAWVLPLPPEQSRDLQATAFFRVARDGRVEELNLVQASGNPLFDASLIRAIKRASPLPVLPADYSGEVLEVEMRFRARES